MFPRSEMYGWGGVFAVNGYKFVWNIIQKNIHQCVVENRNLFMNTFIENQKFPINCKYCFSNGGNKFHTRR